MPANLSYIGSNQVTSSNTVVLANVTTDGSNNRLLLAVACVFNNANSVCNATAANWGATSLTVGVNTIVGVNYHWFSGYIADPAANGNADLTFTVDITANAIVLHAFSLYNANRTAFSNSAVAAQSNQSSMSANGLTYVANASLISCGFAEADDIIANVAALYSGVGAVNASNTVSNRTPASPVTGAGDVLLATCGVRHVEAHNWSGTGWTKLGQANYSTSWSVSIGYRTSNGANSNPTISWTTAANAQARVFSLRGGRGNNTNNIGFNSSNTGNTSPHVTPVSNTTRANSSLVYIDHSRANTSVGACVNRTERIDTGGVQGPYRLAMGDGYCGSNGTNLGAVNVTGAANNWGQWDLEILASILSASNIANGGNGAVGYWTRVFASWDANSGSDLMNIAISKPTNSALGASLNISILEDLSGGAAGVIPVIRFNQAQHRG